MLLLSLYLTHRNELLGLEGMVKLKNPDDIVHVAATPTRTNSDDLTVSADSKVSASVSFENEKRYVQSGQLECCAST